jgi:hypothetical protein
MVAFKLMVWSWKLNDLQRGGLTSRQFIRYQLMQLKLGETLTHVKRTRPRPIAPVEEILALKLELRPTCMVQIFRPFRMHQKNSLTQKYYLRNSMGE